MPTAEAPQKPPRCVPRSSRLLLLGFLGAAMLSACRTESTIREIDPDLNRMLEVPRYDSYEQGRFFADGMAMRRPPSGTVPYSDSGNAPRGPLGFGGSRSPSQIPLELTSDLLASGREHFETVCAACHGMLGDGNTVVASRMRRSPPSLHQPRLRKAPASHIYRVIEQGYGFMPDYAAHFDETGRWAVVAYVRALQLSRHAPLAELPRSLAEQARRELR